MTILRSYKTTSTNLQTSSPALWGYFRGLPSILQAVFSQQAPQHQVVFLQQQLGYDNSKQSLQEQQQ